MSKKDLVNELLRLKESNKGSVEIHFQAEKITDDYDKQNDTRYNYCYDSLIDNYCDINNVDNALRLLINGIRFNIIDKISDVYKLLDKDEIQKAVGIVFNLYLNFDLDENIETNYDDAIFCRSDLISNLKDDINTTYDDNERIIKLGKQLNKVIDSSNSYLIIDGYSINKVNNIDVKTFLDNLGESLTDKYMDKLAD